MMKTGLSPREQAALLAKSMLIYSKYTSVELPSCFATHLLEVEKGSCVTIKVPDELELHFFFAIAVSAVQSRLEQSVDTFHDPFQPLRRKATTQRELEALVLALTVISLLEINGSLTGLNKLREGIFQYGVNPRDWDVIRDLVTKTHLPKSGAEKAIIVQLCTLIAEKI